MNPLRRYILAYLHGKGAVVKGAGFVSRRPGRMGPTTYSTTLMRQDFNDRGAA